MFFSTNMGSRGLERSSEIDRILEEELSESEKDDSDADPDFQLYSDHDTESDVGLEENDELDNNSAAEVNEERDNVQVHDGSGDAPITGRAKNYILGKDKKTKWQKNLPTQNVRTRSHNIVTHFPGNLREARDIQTPLEAWSLFFNEPLVDLVLESTNIFINSVKNNYTHDPNLARPTSSVEIKAYLGLLYLSGVLHGGHMNLGDFWATDGTGTEIFRAGMSFRRFRFLSRCIRFDDITTRNARKTYDNIAAVRQLLDILVSNCRKYYSISECATLDEMLVPFRGRCKFRMYIPNKPAKYGIKVFILACSKTYYVKNFEVYCGTQPKGAYEVSNKADDVIFRLVEPIKGSGRNVTLDNWFTSYDAANTLLKEYNLTLVGTVRKNKPQIPPSFLPKSNREQYSSLFGFQEDFTLVSYVPKKNKCVILLSSMHHDYEIDPSTEEKKKPSIITYYNSSKGGVDVADAMCAEYSVARGTRRWPLTMFFAAMNIAALNAYIVFKTKNQSTTRRSFLKDLGKQMIQPFLITRAQQGNLPREIRRLAAKLSGYEAEPKEDPAPGKRGRCSMCKDNKTKYFCKECKVWLCLSHADMLCSDCSTK